VIIKSVEGLWKFPQSERSSSLVNSLGNVGVSCTGIDNTRDIHTIERLAFWGHWTLGNVREDEGCSDLLMGELHTVQEKAGPFWDARAIIGCDWSGSSKRDALCCSASTFEVLNHGTKFKSERCMAQVLSCY